MTKTGPRQAQAGYCPQCHQPTIRGIDQYGRVAEADRAELDAAHELDAHLYGRITYTAKWRGHMELDARTGTDILTHPAGYKHGKILREHRCQMEPENYAPNTL